MHNIVSISPYELCLSPRVTKGWRQKERNSFVSETTEFAGIVNIIIDILMAIQHFVYLLYTYRRSNKRRVKTSL